ncbi:MAG: hypothetical protein K8W52_33670 [Deltaproteobacteria bacterium]|nr:hypothetical protein [Deltaproteobacteria bacterium]
MTRRVPLIVIVLPLAFSQLGATDCGSIIKDPGFDLWCGDRLCDWKTERGKVAQVPTWHEGDDGVELVGDDVVISQATPVNSNDGICIKFSMLTDIETDAEVHLQFDIYGDTTVDYDTRVPTANWRPVEYKVLITPPYDGITFRLTKTGKGRAVLAEIAAETSSDCPNNPITPQLHPDGARCYFDADCASGTCASGICGECRLDTDCPLGSTCGADWGLPFLSPFANCIADDSRQLGERCSGAAECATGFCSGVCDACDASCTDGHSCAQVADVLLPDNVGVWQPPRTCGPNLGDRAAGATCWSGADCASGGCTGEVLHICADDGRSCTTDLDCQVDSNLDHLPCVAVGTPRGTCQ